MTTRPPDLPDFERPPVVEVALAVQFEPLAGFGTKDIAEFWAATRDRFPNWDDAPPMSAVQERFGAPIPPRPPTFKVGKGPAPNRAILGDPSGNEILQLQSNCLAHNWRKVGDGDEYPRYERIRQAFARDLRDFREHLERRGGPPLLPTQCEVTYVNHVFAGAGWERFGELPKIIAPWSGASSDGFLPEPETSEVGAHYVFRTEGGEPLGRLHISAQPQYRAADLKPLVALTLTARGRPKGQSDDEVLGWLDLGRGWIVRGFASFTTKAMHQVWGRRDGS